MSNNNSSSNDLLLPLPLNKPGVERHTLAAEEELRLEIAFASVGSSKGQRVAGCILTLQQGSCELFGIELAIGKPLVAD
jgi:hypothetical protein